ncbi:carbohydrate ABC transporter permease [Neobacillus drentensis]|uniref:carbohydrate ABC transporter permease n=1 Tax=Neobacillus drentensis TaxID=220684 RepID=UPI00286203F0|nr:sugar ABC transporter permease [Neobacillus drentensis]MDR7238860.1 ABC-type sugar transport system permease subunit [Neobacillus drentensis]
MNKPRNLTTIGFLFPGVGLLAVFIIFPILLTAWVSLNHWSMLTPLSEMNFVGFENYSKIFDQDTFKKALVNTFMYSISNLIVMIPLSLILGLLLYQAALKGTAIVRTFLFLPYIIPSVAVAIVWGYLYSPMYGPFNEILDFFHLPAQQWLGSLDQAMMSLVILNVWQTLGYYVIIVIAGLTEISQDYYEAASIDGANAIQKLFYITIPLLKRSMSFIVIIMTINTLQVFDPIYVLTQGGPANSTTVVSYHMYDTAFNFGNAGQASAMAFILYLVVLLFTILQLRLFKTDY